MIAGRQPRRIYHWGILSVLALGVAGCSAESTRLSENPNGNPYGYAQPSNQVSAAPMPAQVAAIQRQPLPQPQYAQSQYAQPQYAPVQYAPTQQPYPQPEYAQAAPPRAAPEVTGAVHSSGYWDADGGTVVVMAQGETVDIIARRWNVPARAILQANNITGAGVAAPGQRLVIPHYVVNGTGAKLAHAAAPRTPPAGATQTAAPPAAPHAAPVVAAAPAPARATQPAASSPAHAAPQTTGALASAPVGSAQTLLPAPPVHTVASGDNLGRIAHKYHVKVKDLAVANGIAPETPLKIGQQLTVPVKLVATPPKGAPGKPGAPAVAQAGAPAGAAKPSQVARGALPAAAPGKVASAEQPGNARVASPVEAAPEEVNLTAPNGAPAFRWPARGRVINGFRAKVNGATNDGIDLAVPEGTQIRAADDGVVAYAGNELKGYGNLVLVRHSNGFVTAYANASELMVKRNDQVHKGQVILKSGQTGNAGAPQLHFEVRKNSSPVDPMQYLPSDKTASAPL
jgi:murein DD-endopeptidase MepM/ murein hydrolase activator NlpD